MASPHLVPAATVTTGAKPHGQQQNARDLEVERAVMGQRCRPQSFGEVQRCYPLYFVPHTQYLIPKPFLKFPDKLIGKGCPTTGVLSTRYVERKTADSIAAPRRNFEADSAAP